MKFLIAYQLQRESDQVVENIPQAIYSIDSNAKKYFRDLWVISSDHPASEISEQIRKVLDGQDKLFVTKLTKDTDLSGFSKEEVTSLMGELKNG